ncbi:MAG: Fibronectin, type domain protein [Oscillospiraceae bacterium]|nr:Fibronectin, type domain protein [Oscillospiraceae bacterium]
MKKLKNCISVFLAAVIMTAAFCTPALAVVSQYDSKYLSSSQQDKIAKYTSDYNKAYASGDTAGMTAAHKAAETVRATASYSGGTDGSEYHPWSSGSSGSSSSGGSSSTTTKYTITATAGTGGSISPSGSTSVTKGNSKTFTITANSGYKIADVKVDSSSVGALSTYTFSSVNAAHTISATFASAASLSAGSATLGDGGSGTLSSGTTKSGYGITASLPVTSSYVSDTTVTASYNFTFSKTVSLEYVNGTWQFPVNSSSATSARKIYIPVETKDGTYTITFTVKALDPQATALTGSNVYLTSTKSVTLTIKGSMYDDDATGDS